MTERSERNIFTHYDFIFFPPPRRSLTPLSFLAHLCCLSFPARFFPPMAAASGAASSKRARVDAEDGAHRWQCGIMESLSLLFSPFSFFHKLPFLTSRLPSSSSSLHRLSPSPSFSLSLLDNDEGDAIPLDVPSDVEAAMLLLLSHVPKDAAFPRVVLKHQLYHVLPARTAADRGLVGMGIRRGVWKD